MRFPCQEALSGLAWLPSCAQAKLIKYQPPTKKLQNVKTFFKSIHSERGISGPRRPRAKMKFEKI